MKKIIVFNWKANPKTVKEAVKLFLQTEKGIADNKNIEAVVCPPFPFLTAVKPLAKKTRLGAQDCSWEEYGPYTGEVPAGMLKKLGVDYVILGHSERRALGESNEIVAKKVQAALANGLKTIVCVGETAKERKRKQASAVIKRQLVRSLKYLINPSTSSGQANKLTNLIVAYEPVWAVVSEAACFWQEAEKNRQKIKEILRDIFGPENDKISVLYGGSVDGKNAPNYLKKAGFDGLLVGNASLKPKEIKAIFQLLA
jgi:triosephosphate isomerase